MHNLNVGLIVAILIGLGIAFVVYRMAKNRTGSSPSKGGGAGRGGSGEEIH